MRRLIPRAIEPSGTDGDVLKTVGGVSVWTADPPPVIELDGLTDVDTSTAPPVDGNVLTWDEAAGVWHPESVPEPPPVGLDDLTDVDTSTTLPAEGDTLTWDSVGGFWKPVAPLKPPNPLAPWTTTNSAGEPEFMWDENNSLMMTEET